MDTFRYYCTKTGRRPTFEYSLIEGVNDGLTHARELAAFLTGLNCHVNLIPLNPVRERNYRKSEASAVQKFKNILEKNRINVTIRREMGSDIEAACGQLRNSFLDKSGE
jgi:23S rRNA (adenine2503-C2)-methyltransferase